MVAVEQPAVKRTKQAQIKAKENPTCDKTTAEDRGEEVQAKKVVKRKIPVRKKLGPLAERTTDSRLRVGAHVSAAGGTLPDFDHGLRHGILNRRMANVNLTMAD